MEFRDEITDRSELLERPLREDRTARFMEELEEMPLEARVEELQRGVERMAGMNITP
jgi:hypothetical protein